MCLFTIIIRSSFGRGCHPTLTHVVKTNLGLDQKCCYQARQFISENSVHFRHGFVTVASRWFDRFDNPFPFKYILGAIFELCFRHGFVTLSSRYPKVAVIHLAASHGPCNWGDRLTGFLSRFILPNSLGSFFSFTLDLL